QLAEARAEEFRHLQAMDNFGYDPTLHDDLFPSYSDKNGLHSQFKQLNELYRAGEKDTDLLPQYTSYKTRGVNPDTALR
ncbi:hypothetical protein NL476_28325, partial [Klebsiella pneumoniae]|nr:hypothetical protein [Klebsiella pneumoniae]